MCVRVCVYVGVFVYGSSCLCICPCVFACVSLPVCLVWRQVGFVFFLLSYFVFVFITFVVQLVYCFLVPLLGLLSFSLELLPVCFYSCFLLFEDDFVSLLMYLFMSLILLFVCHVFFYCMCLLFLFAFVFIFLFYTKYRTAPDTKWVEWWAA